MVQANEIRIGNYFEHNENWCYRNSHLTSPPKFNFAWEERDWYALGECTMFLEDCFHIPLTPEILERCGFEYGNGKFNEWWVSGKFTLYNNGYKNKNDIEFEESFYKVRIKYFHQLQNLYYALTGEELEIKELQPAQ